MNQFYNCGWIVSDICQFLNFDQRWRYRPHKGKHHLTATECHLPYGITQVNTPCLDRPIPVKISNTSRKRQHNSMVWNYFIENARYSRWVLDYSLRCSLSNRVSNYLDNTALILSSIFHQQHLLQSAWTQKLPESGIKLLSCSSSCQINGMLTCWWPCYICSAIDFLQLHDHGFYVSNTNGNLGEYHCHAEE